MTTNVLYAAADGGQSLPVIDVTNSAFRVAPSEQELSALTAQFLEEQQRQQPLSAAMMEALRASTLGRAVMASAGSYLSGMATYRMKLGPANLGPDAGMIDLGIASSFPAFGARLRLQDMAQLQAEVLAPIIAKSPERGVCLLNIAGGACADSWNALIAVNKANPGLLTGRAVTIVALDIDDSGPAFGQQALARLQQPDGPLGGLRIRLEHIPYQWNEAGALAELLAQREAAGMACVASSEGGLFEYGEDVEIVANLAALRAGTADDAAVVGSVTRKCELQDVLQRNNLAKLKPRTLEEFGLLARQAGWTMERAIERPFTFNVRLKRR